MRPCIFVTITAGILVLILGVHPAWAIQQTNLLPEVQPVNWSGFSAEMVDDADAYRPWYPNGPRHSLSYYLGHLHQLANAVRVEDPHRGFIELSVWRGPEENVPQGARIMENVTSLAWFYTKKESWNPYYGDEALRSRLEAAIQYWVNLQYPEGEFAHLPNYRSLAATAFAAKFMGETVVLLKDGPPIDPHLLQRLRQSLRKAIMQVFQNEKMWGRGLKVSNQYQNAFAGALAYLQVYADDEMETAVERRMRMAVQGMVSPAGYMYENYGPDWGYYFGTHLSNIHMIWHYGHSRPLRNSQTAEPAKTFGDLVKDEFERTVGWLSYNAVLQPDGDVFFLNCAIETRQSMAVLERIETPLAEAVPLARAFNVSKEEQQQRLAWSRQELKRDWGGPPPLAVGQFMGYSPYAFLHRHHAVWYPSEKQQGEARLQLPYMAEIGRASWRERV